MTNLNAGVAVVGTLLSVLLRYEKHSKVGHLVKYCTNMGEPEPVKSLEAGPSGMTIPFEYQQLESSSTIRLLKILPGNPEDDINCEIFHALLNQDGSTPDYTALSYVWGPPKPQKAINCNGFRFAITKNLQGAIRALRKVDEMRVMWIDQICINQQDNEERCAQVQIMKVIYSTAKETIAWLGINSGHYRCHRVRSSLERYHRRCTGGFNGK